MKSEKVSNGPLGNFINQYLQIRRALGFLLRSAEGILIKFDLYMLHHFPQAKTVTKPMIVGYLQTLKHLQGSTVYLQVSCLRQFCRFLFKFNPDTYIPEKTLIHQGAYTRKPHIYTKVELTELIKLARTLPPKSSLRPHTYTTLFSLLWVSGLRIGEALRLNLEDVDTDNAVLHVKESKFFKSRLVPLAASSAAALETYRRLRAEQGHDQRPEAAFFVNEYARRCSHSTVGITFRALIQRSGIRTVQGQAPRLHDFRHTFATRCLDEIYEKGNDPNATLPLLATYLGHVNIAHTQVYLHPEPGLLTTAGQRFRAHYQSANSSEGGRHEGI
jgi:integrase/recombinase XerD